MLPKPPKMSQVRRLLEEMVDGFAQEIQPTYVKLKHTWYVGGGKPYIPNRFQIAGQALSLIEALTGHEAEDKTYNHTSQGGIKASWVVWPHGALEVRLDYVPQSTFASVSPQDVE